VTKIKSLIEQWQESASSPVTDCEYAVPLPLYTAVKIEALAELFPGKTKQQIITELLCAALDELEEAFPYVKGNKIIAHDEVGDPVYEDVGLTSAFIKLSEQHLNKLGKL
jgi:hypothetical protein